MFNSTKVMTERTGDSDAELVAACLGGDREAFARIVERYQRLLCSLAYATTGSISESEDLAQEAFVTAWQQLGKLREPEKLKPWLCTILRHRVGRALRRDRKNPARQAGELIVEAAPASDEPCTTHQAMKREEESLLWQALEGVPERYREPLVLYYREERSVSHVAEALDLTESAVKQRLVRGRKMLKERMLAFVEGALQQSAPGPVFTAGVVAAIATLGTPAKAAVVGASGAAASKAGVTTAKTAWFAWLVAFTATISGAISTLFAVRAGLDQSRTRNERRYTIVVASVVFGSFVLLVLAMLGLKWAALHWTQQQVLLAWLSQVLVLAFAIGWPVLFARLLRGSRELRRAERLRQPEAFRDARDQIGSSAGEYRSRLKLLGVPLLHFRFALPEPDSPPVVGWIAGGDRAIGILFAWGGLAVAPVSVGGIAIGVFSLGAVSFGLLSLGSIAFGILALGAMGIGINAFGSLSAMAWNAAAGGGFNLAGTYAVGPIALAAHANDEAARNYFASPHTDLYLMTFFIVVIVMTLVPVILYARAVRRRLGRSG